ncbi:MAG TPA: hypothetical protein VFJ51_01180 [Nitrososphaeraceae archaeon]|nr:hypothetical protein [Nitrososphaeraceae archaeon]
MRFKVSINGKILEAMTSSSGLAQTYHSPTELPKAPWLFAGAFVDV